MQEKEQNQAVKTLRLSSFIIFFAGFLGLAYAFLEFGFTRMVYLMLFFIIMVLAGINWVKSS